MDRSSVIMLGRWKTGKAVNCMHCAARIIDFTTSDGREITEGFSSKQLSRASRIGRLADTADWEYHCYYRRLTAYGLILSFLIYTGACQDLVRPTRPKALQACRSSEEGSYSRSPTSPASPTRCPSSHSAIQHQGQARPRIHSFRVEAGWCRQEGGQGFGYRYRSQEEPKVRGKREGQRREAQGVQEQVDRLPEEGRQGQEG